jgi:hypothetical protein
MTLFSRGGAAYCVGYNARSPGRGLRLSASDLGWPGSLSLLLLVVMGSLGSPGRRAQGDGAPSGNPGDSAGRWRHAGSAVC